MKENFYNKRKAGLPPGTIFYTGEAVDKSIEMESYSFEEGKVVRKVLKDSDDLSFIKESKGYHWLNVNGIHDTELINKIGQIFNINSLVLEDLTNTNQRVKIEIWEEYIFIVLKMVSLNNENRKIEYEQVSFILGKNYLITFQEKQGDVFDAVRKRIEMPASKIGQRGIGYMAYAVIDVMVDNYFIILDFIEEKIDELENEILSNCSRELTEQILKLKAELSILKKRLYPIREISTKFQGEEILSYFDKSNKMYLSDLHDHGITICEIIDNMILRTSELFQLYYSTLSNDMNNVMKVLAVISTIFMPLSFLAGVYGMNFKYMPELEWRFGYFILLGIMAALVIIMFVIFKKKKWF